MEQKRMTNREERGTNAPVNKLMLFVLGLFVVILVDLERIANSIATLGDGETAMEIKMVAPMVTEVKEKLLRRPVDHDEEERVVKINKGSKEIPYAMLERHKSMMDVVLDSTYTAFNMQPPKELGTFRQVCEKMKNGELKPVEYLAQYGQDWVMMEVVKLMGKTTPGLFLDVAAAFPQKFSNTAMLESCMGWTGLCVEGDPVKWINLFTNRGCTVQPNCVSSQVETLTFRSGDSGVAGIRGVALAEKFYNKVQYQDTLVQCLPLGMMLERNEVQYVDFMSLDIEGFEGMAISGMLDYPDIVIDVIVIEIHHCCMGNDPTVKRNRDLLLSYLKRHDYVPVVGVFANSNRFECGTNQAQQHNMLGKTLEESFAVKKISDMFFVRKDSKYLPYFKKLLEC